MPHMQDRGKVGLGTDVEVVICAEALADVPEAHIFIATMSGKVHPQSSKTFQRHAVHMLARGFTCQKFLSVLEIVALLVYFACCHPPHIGHHGSQSLQAQDKLAV